MTHASLMPTATSVPFSTVQNTATTQKVTKLVSGLNVSGLDASRPDGAEEADKTREQFQNILGELLFGQMLKSMRKTVGEAAYFNGGRAEEIFTEQLDQHIARGMSKTMSEQLVGPMYELTTLGRK